MTEEKKFLTVQEILHSKDLKEEEIYVEEWGGWLLLREITAGDRDWIEASMLKDAQEPGALTMVNAQDQKVSAEKFRLRLVTISIVNPETKERLFSNKMVEQLAGKSNTAINKIVSAVFKLNGMTQEEVDAVGEDCERIGGESSNSDSLENSDALPQSLTEELVSES